MTTKAKKPSRIMAEMKEMADAKLAIGTMDADTHSKITMLTLNRDTCDREVLTLDDFTAADIETLEASQPPAESAAFDHELKP